MTIKSNPQIAAETKKYLTEMESMQLRKVLFYMEIQRPRLPNPEQ